MGISCVPPGYTFPCVLTTLANPLFPRSDLVPPVSHGSPIMLFRVLKSEIPIHPQSKSPSPTRPLKPQRCWPKAPRPQPRSSPRLANAPPSIFALQAVVVTRNPTRLPRFHQGSRGDHFLILPFSVLFSFCYLVTSSFHYLYREG